MFVLQLTRNNSLLLLCVCVWLMFLLCAVDSAGAFDDTYAEINSSDEDTGLKADRRASVAWEGGVAAWLPDGDDDRYDVVQGERRYEVPSSRASKNAAYAANIRRGVKQPRRRRGCRPPVHAAARRPRG